MITSLIFAVNAFATPVCQAPSTLKTDFPQLCRYEAANAALPPADANRVVFFGDSITEMWTTQLPLAGAIDRGISGQTTQQMLIRFHADVLDLRPAAVHILAGTNDIAENTGPTNLKRITDDIDAMITLAESRHITVYLGSVLPTTRYPWNSQIVPAPLIAQLNEWLRAKAAADHLTYIDYYSTLTDGAGAMNPNLTTDGVHPNAAGFAKMNDVFGASVPRR